MDQWLCGICDVMTCYVIVLVNYKVRTRTEDRLFPNENEISAFPLPLAYVLFKASVVFSPSTSKRKLSRKLSLLLTKESLVSPVSQLICSSSQNFDRLSVVSKDCATKTICLFYNVSPFRCYKSIRFEG